MYRSFVTALAAVALAAAFITAADADPRASLHRVAAGETLASIAASEGVSIAELARLNGIDGATRALPAGTVLALEQDAVEASVPPPAVVPADAQAQLRAIETESAMPSADADLKMWGARGVSAAPLFSASPATMPDTMHRFARGIVSRTSSIARTLTRDAMRFIGTPYVFGGTSPAGFDCSGYVQHVFAMLGIRLPRTADAQFYTGRPTEGGMLPGDLVFFQTYEPGPSHVGIYLGGGRFIHSSSHGVRISRIGDTYWSARYLGGKRVTSRVASR